MNHILGLYRTAPPPGVSPTSTSPSTATFVNPRRTGPPPRSVLVLAHSMGGVVLRAALMMGNHKPGSVRTALTFNSPHQSHPYVAERTAADFYATVNTAWARASAALRSAPDDVPAAGAQTGLPLAVQDLVMVSFGGGARDTTVRSDLASLQGLLPPSQALTVFTTGAPGVWLQADHQCILWCGQLVASVTRALLRVASEEYSATGALPSVAARLHTMKQHFEDPLPRLLRAHQGAAYQARNAVAAPLVSKASSLQTHSTTTTTTTTCQPRPGSSDIGQRAWHPERRGGASLHWEGPRLASSHCCIALPQYAHDDSSASSSGDASTGLGTSSGDGGARTQVALVTNLPSSKLDVSLIGTASPAALVALPDWARRAHLHKSADALLSLSPTAHQHSLSSAPDAWQTGVLRLLATSIPVGPAEGAPPMLCWRSLARSNASSIREDGMAAPPFVTLRIHEPAPAATALTEAARVRDTEPATGSRHGLLGRLFHVEWLAALHHWSWRIGAQGSAQQQAAGAATAERLVHRLPTSVPLSPMLDYVVTVAATSSSPCLHTVAPGSAGTRSGDALAARHVRGGEAVAGSSPGRAAAFWPVVHFSTVVASYGPAGGSDGGDGDDDDDCAGCESVVLTPAHSSEAPAGTPATSLTYRLSTHVLAAASGDGSAKTGALSSSLLTVVADPSCSYQVTLEPVPASLLGQLLKYRAPLLASACVGALLLTFGLQLRAWRSGAFAWAAVEGKSKPSGRARGDSATPASIVPCVPSIAETIVSHWHVLLASCVTQAVAAVLLNELLGAEWVYGSSSAHLPSSSQALPMEWRSPCVMEFLVLHLAAVCSLCGVASLLWLTDTIRAGCDRLRRRSWTTVQLAVQATRGKVATPGFVHITS